MRAIIQNKNKRTIMILFSLILLIPWLYVGWKLLGFQGIPNMPSALMKKSPKIEGKSPSWSPDGQQIAFIPYFGGYVYLVNEDGSDLTQLTNVGTELLKQAIWSPDGRKIALFNAVEFYVVDVAQAQQSSGENGTIKFPYSKTYCTADWSPDSQYIVFSTCEYDNYNIFISKSDGTLVYTFKGNQNSYPAWSPDGSKIAFSSTNNHQADVFTVKPDGSDLQNLTHSTEYEYSPVWSPDGSAISYIKSKDIDNNSEIWKVDSDGSGNPKLIYSSEPNTMIILLTWSPDSKYLAFMVSEITESVDGDTLSGIFIVRSDGSDFRKIADTGNYNDWYHTNLAWSPDSQTIAFPTSSYKIILVDVNGENQQELWK